MTDVQQLQDLAAEVLAGLTAPGQPLELDNEDVLGVRMTVFKNRDRSLGALLPPSTQHGERDYLVTAERRISFVEHVQRVASLATSLRDDYGVRSGDRVAIIAANSPEW